MVHLRKSSQFLFTNRWGVNHCKKKKKSHLYPMRGGGMSCTLSLCPISGRVHYMGKMLIKNILNTLYNII